MKLIEGFKLISAPLLWVDHAYVQIVVEDYDYLAGVVTLTA